MPRCYINFRAGFVIINPLKWFFRNMQIKQILQSEAPSNHQSLNFDPISRCDSDISKVCLTGVVGM